MPKKKTSSTVTNHAKRVEHQVYKDCEIDIAHFDAEQSLLIDKKETEHYRDADNGTYLSPDLPYQCFGSLQELAEAIIDEKVGE